MSEPTERARLRVHVLGPIRATVDGREVDLGGPRQRTLLAVLASRRGQSVPNDVIVDAIWDGDPPDAADRTFRSYVARLRRAVDRAGLDGSVVVATTPGGYRLDGSVELDAAAFEADVAAARDLLERGELADAVRVVGDALATWSGDSYGPLADRPWAAPDAVRLEELRLVATELRARALLDADRVPQAVALLEELAAAEPYREPVARLHALALHRSGRDADAMRTLRSFRDRLVEDHGLDPSDQLAELEAMILDRDPRLDRPVAGRRLRGYVLHEPIARSPLGTVHRAEQPSIGREVAVTVLPAELADDPEVVRAFEARLTAVASLDHPHVLPVYDHWREPGSAYVVTRLPNGTLGQRLRADGTVGTVLSVGAQLAAALAAAHERGVVHGAVGPDAVVVDARGDAFLWGFPLTVAADARTVATPARDVAALGTLLLDALDRARPGDGDTIVATAARTLLERAVEPGGGPVVQAAALASGLAAARDGAGDVPTVPVEAGPNPYRGLAAFTEADAGVFHGRSALTEQLLARVRRHRAVAVVGPSGSGKSSVVRAGMLPRLRAQGAFVTTMVPGTRPLAELEVALRRVSAVPLVDAADEVAGDDGGLTRLVTRVLPAPGAELVLVVDQFEELFTIADPTEARLLLAALAAAVADADAPLRVVVTLRADFLAAALRDPVAGPLLQQRSVMVAPMDDDELVEVVTGPAELAGVAVEPALVSTIVADASRSPGSLPMVQFALTETFAAAAADGVMSLAAYRRIGGIEGVLGQRAEEVFDALPGEHQRSARQLFSRLVVPGRDGPPTRRRAARTELEHVPDEVLEAFGGARLLRFDTHGETREPTVEVSHEALFRAWPRLAGWIDAGADELRVLRHLTDAATDWDHSGRPEAELYRGERLDAALEFAAGDHDLAPTERAFLDAARRRRAAQETAARRDLRRSRLLSAGLALGLVLALVAGGIALDARRSAQVDALAAAASGEVDEDPERASVLAARAYTLAPDLESQRALLEVLDVEPRILSLRATPADTCGEPTGSGEQVLFSSVGLEGEVLELRTLDQEVLRRWLIDSAPGVTCSGITPSGRHVFERHRDRYVVLDLELEEVASRSDVLAPADQRSMDLHPTREEAALVLAGGEVAIVSLPDLTTVRVLDLDLGESTTSSGPVEQDGSSGPPTTSRTVAYSEDGSLLAVADGDTVHVVDDAGRPVASAPATLHSRGGVRAFVSAGAGVFGHLTERALVVHRLDDPSRTSTVQLRALSTPYRRGVAVEPGGSRVGVATEQGVQVLDVADLPAGDVTPGGEAVPVDANIIDLFWSGPGRLNGAGPNGVLQLDVDRTLLLGQQVAPLPPREGVTTTTIDVADDGSGVVTLVFGAPPAEPEMLYRDLRTGRERSLGLPGPVTPLPDGRVFTVDRVTGTASVGDAEGDTVEFEDALAGAGGRWVDSVTRATGDRATVLFVGDGGSRTDPSVVVVFDTTTAVPLAVLEPPEGRTWTAAVPLDDDRVLVADQLYEWSVLAHDGTVLRDGVVHGAGYEVAAVDPVGGRYATTDWNGDVHVVDPATGEQVDIAGPASFAFDVRFAGPDRLVSNHLDGSTYLWDVPARTLVGRLWDGPALTPWGIAVDAEADELLQVTPTGVARIPLDPDVWHATVCARIDRGPTERELAAISAGLEPGPSCPG